MTTLITAFALCLFGTGPIKGFAVTLSIRENLRKTGQESLRDVINRSINEVLSRTIITSSTVFMVLIALPVMGGVLRRDFALALLIGIVVGTYSSIFVASPIVYVWPVAKNTRSGAAERVKR